MRSQIARAGLVMTAVIALWGVADGASAATPAVYQASLNAMCRANTVKLHALEAELASARKTGDGRAYTLALGEYFGLGLREDATIETTAVPAAIRPRMAPTIALLRRADADVRAVLADLATGNQTAVLTKARELAALTRPLDNDLDAAGLRDCGSNQT